MTTVQHKKVAIKELTELYSNLKSEYKDLLDSLLENDWNQVKDTRIVTINFIFKHIQNTEVLLDLIDEHFENLSLWESQEWGNQPQKDEVLRKILNPILLDIKCGLFINAFIRFENFIKIISNSIGLACKNKINPDSKKLIDELGISTDYKELIDIFTYSRNTMHTEGFHTWSKKERNYKGKNYLFEQNQPILFFDDNFVCHILIEIKSLIEDIISSDKVSSQSYIPHTYKDLIFEYEE